MAKIKVIYEVNALSVWKDDELIFMNIPSNGLTFCMTQEPWDDFMKDLKKLVNKK